MPTLQVDNINGKHLDAVYGEGEPSAHYIFFWARALMNTLLVISNFWFLEILATETAWNFHPWLPGC